MGIYVFNSSVAYHRPATRSPISRIRSAPAVATSRSWRSTAPAISGSRGIRTRRLGPGFYVQQLNPATGAALSPPVKAPNSESSNNNSFGSSLTCAATCRLVYGNSPAAGRRIRSSRGGRAPLRRRSRTSRAPRRAPAASSRPPIAPTDASGSPGSTARPTAPPSATRPARAARPRTWASRPAPGSPSSRWRGMAVGDNLLLAANYLWKDATDPAPLALFVNTDRASGAGDQGAGPARRPVAGGAGQVVPHPGAVHDAQGLHRSSRLHAARRAAHAHRPPRSTR